jgi:hypothetical protein
MSHHITVDFQHPANAGILIVGYAEGTHAYALLLPPTARQEALQQGAKRIHHYPNSTFDLASGGKEWGFGKWLKDEVSWCLAAYRFARKERD